MQNTQVQALRGQSHVLSDSTNAISLNTPIHSSQPSVTSIVKVISQPGNYDSYAISRRDYPPGSLLARLVYSDLKPKKPSYLTIQFGPNPTDNLSLDNEFGFTNHSCDPNLEWHISRTTTAEQVSETLINTTTTRPGQDVTIDILVIPRLDNEGNETGIKQGEPLTFFYPSTEWDMAQPFKCSCGTNRCLGTVMGARDLDSMVLKRYYANKFIWEMKRDQEKLGEEVEVEPTGNR